MNHYIKPIPENIKHVNIDIGLSYSAPQSQVWLSNTPDLFVFGFEPNPDCIESILNGNIQKKSSFHGTPIQQHFLENNFCLIPVALGNVPEPTHTTFYQMANDCGTSSIFTPTDSSIGPVKNVTTVPIYSLKHFFDLFPWEKFEYIEYIKIDAQGSDYDILVGAGDYLKERVVYITAEPDYLSWSNCSHNNASNITAYLESQGFERIHHPNTSDPTFINKKFHHLRDSIFIWQQG
jgi:FkbM family methyltransferase